MLTDTWKWRIKGNNRDLHSLFPDWVNKLQAAIGLVRQPKHKVDNEEFAPLSAG